MIYFKAIKMIRILIEIVMLFGGLYLIVFRMRIFSSISSLGPRRILIWIGKPLIHCNFTGIIKILREGKLLGELQIFPNFFSRPVMRFNPYSTPNPQIFVGSSSTPPWGGVRSMCGYNAARSLNR